MLAIGLMGLQAVLLMAILATCLLRGAWSVWGIAIWILAVVVFGLALFRLGRSLTPSPIPNRNGLRTRGIYGIIRHPMYLSLLIFGIGGVAFTHWAAIPLAFLAVLLKVKIDLEERLLQECYPEFEEYRSRTKKLIPYVW